MSTPTAAVPTLPALSDAASILKTLPGVRYALAYGSHARGRASTRSDLDLLFVFDQTPDLGTIRYLVARVQHLHTAHDLALDHEVAYDLKLWSTCGQVRAALDLAGFLTGPGAGPQVTVATADPVYLNSPVFKARLVFNALTSPHVFLGGDGLAHRRAVRQAAASLTRIARAATGNKPVDGLHDLVAALVTDPVTAATGEEWLGYRTSDGPHLYALLASAASVELPRRHHA